MSGRTARLWRGYGYGLLTRVGCAAMSHRRTSFLTMARYRRSSSRSRGSSRRRSPSRSSPTRRSSSRGRPVKGYTIRGKGGRVKYVGITNNPRRRAAQHRCSGKRGRLKVETGGMSRGKARRRLRETLHRPVEQPSPGRVRRTHAQDHRQRHRRPAPAPRPRRHDRRRQHPPHPSHRRQGGDATDQLTQRAEHLATTGQFCWPRTGSSTVRHWADPTGP